MVYPQQAKCFTMYVLLHVHFSHTTMTIELNLQCYVYTWMFKYEKKGYNNYSVFIYVT